MFSFKERFGVPGVLAVLALVFAMAGGAYAAKGVIITKLSQIKPSVQKQLKGQTGPKGATGAAGAQGPAGKEGPAGTAGKEGATGATGATGKAGAKGNPWTAGGTLPADSTETGTWNTPGTLPPPGSPWLLPISFSIPLSSDLVWNEDPDTGQVHVILPNGKEIDESEGFAEITPPHCPGTVAEPKADSGNLCVYIASKHLGNNAFQEKTSFINVKIHNPSKPEGLGTESEPGASTTGATLAPNVLLEEGGYAYGTWAVTG